MGRTVWQHVRLSVTVKPTTDLVLVCHLRYDQEMWHHPDCVTLRLQEKTL